MKWGIWDRQLRYCGLVVAESAEAAIAAAKRQGLSAPAVRANLGGRGEVTAWRASPGLQFDRKGGGYDIR